MSAPQQSSDSLPEQPVAEREPPLLSNQFVILIGLIMLVGLVTLAWLGSQKAVNMAGNRLPARIELQPLLNTDAPIEQGSLEGKIAVLHFWGTWCPPCVLEFPEFVELAQRFKNEEDVQIVSVSCSSGPELDLTNLKERSQQFLDKYDTPIPTYSDSSGLTRQELAMLTNSASFTYPTTVVVGRDGVILKSMAGYYEGEMAKLSDLIAENL